MASENTDVIPPADTVLLPRPEEEAGGVATSFLNFLLLCVAVDDGTSGVGGGGSRNNLAEFDTVAEENRDSGMEEDSDEVDDVSSSCAAFAMVLTFLLWDFGKRNLIKAKGSLQIAAVDSYMGTTSLTPMWWMMEEPSAPTTTMLFLAEEANDDGGRGGEVPAGS